MLSSHFCVHAGLRWTAPVLAAGLTPPWPVNLSGKTRSVMWHAAAPGGGVPDEEGLVGLSSGVAAQVIPMDVWRTISSSPPCSSAPSVQRTLVLAGLVFLRLVPSERPFATAEHRRGRRQANRFCPWDVHSAGTSGRPRTGVVSLQGGRMLCHGAGSFVRSGEAFFTPCIASQVVQGNPRTP